MVYVSDAMKKEEEIMVDSPWIEARLEECFMAADSSYENDIILACGEGKHGICVR